MKKLSLFAISLALFAGFATACSDDDSTTDTTNTNTTTTSVSGECVNGKCTCEGSGNLCIGNTAIVCNDGKVEKSTVCTDTQKCNDKTAACDDKAAE